MRQMLRAHLIVSHTFSFGSEYGGNVGNRGVSQVKPLQRILNELFEYLGGNQM